MADASIGGEADLGDSTVGAVLDVWVHELRRCVRNISMKEYETYHASAIEQSTLSKKSAVGDTRVDRVDASFGLCVDLFEEYGRFTCLVSSATGHMPK